MWYHRNLSKHTSSDLHTKRESNIDLECIELRIRPKLHELIMILLGGIRAMVTCSSKRHLNSMYTHHHCAVVCLLSIQCTSIMYDFWKPLRHILFNGFRGKCAKHFQAELHSRCRDCEIKLILLLRTCGVGLSFTNQYGCNRISVSMTQFFTQCSQRVEVKKRHEIFSLDLDHSKESFPSWKVTLT